MREEVVNKSSNVQYNIKSELHNRLLDAEAKHADVVKQIQSVHRAERNVMEREIHDLKQQIINLEDDLDKRNSTMKLFEQEKRVLDQDVVALADELNQCKHNNKEIQQLNFNQNQVIRNLEVQLTETRTKTNQVRETLEEELNRFERKIQDLEMRVHMGLCSEDELKS